MSEFDPASPERLRQSAKILWDDGVTGKPIAAWHAEAAEAAADRIEELTRERDEALELLGPDERALTEWIRDILAAIEEQKNEPPRST